MLFLLKLGPIYSFVLIPWLVILRPTSGEERTFETLLAW
jgi:hypothetical protein